ncbi:DUF1508 domain-containing protein [uncultured Porticoccus sp.]|uniref:DUF1508 domain-containing protein n=1 Tax=uncultured Porticoccus sp. TaxID=1256050 RepID=UPI002613D2FC|nr:DUF1508 domain-containing protein [uncultured Porticoccus sp.]
MSSSYELHKDNEGVFNFSLKTENGETILVSKPYFSKGSAINDISELQHICNYENYYQRNVSAGNEHYFELQTPRRKIIGTSPMFSSAESMENAIGLAKSVGTTKVINSH